MRVSVLMLVISVLMCGCASRFTTAQNAFIGCTNSNPYNSYVDQNVVFIDQNSPNKYRLLSSTDKINQAQKDVFLKYLNFNSSCRKSFMANMGGGGYQVAYSSYYNQVDQIYSKLISGAITIGDANIQKQRAFEKLQYAFQNINQQIAAANERAYQ